MSAKRTRWSDFLQDHLFWAMDVSGSKTLPIFTPLFGFSGITAPRIQVDLESFKDGTYNYPRHIVKGGTVSSVTFTRAASLYDSDFYDWIYYAIEGTRAAQNTGALGSFVNSNSGPVRRSIVVFHFARINLADNGDGLAGTALNTLATGIEASVFAGVAGLSAPASVAVGAATVAATSAGNAIGFSVGPFSAATWLPARAWILYDCLPVSYQSASDFSASSGEISLMNLEVQPEWIEEASFGLKP